MKSFGRVKVVQSDRISSLPYVPMRADFAVYVRSKFPHRLVVSCADVRVDSTATPA